MNETTEQESGDPQRVLAGRKVYSPSVIAAYTALGNLPMGLILYGLNIRARGRRSLGMSMVCFGAAGLAILVVLSLKGSAPRVPLFAVAVFGAINVYQLEKRPFEQALAHGAVRARWWPPALMLLLVTAATAALDWTL